MPEFADENNPFIAALPEFANLARYGGRDLQTNIKAAAFRAKSLQQKLENANAKARSFNSRNPLINENYAIDSNISFTSDKIDSNTVNALFVAANRDPKVREAIKSILGKSRYDGISSTDLPFLIDFLRSDDPNKSVDQLVEERLNRGLTLKPRLGQLSAIGSIVVPFKTENGIVKPAVDTTGYRAGITSLDTFASQNAFPNGIRPETISVRIAATQADFEAQYQAISPTERNLSGAQGVNFTLRSDGTEVKRSTDISGDLSNKRTVIILNHELNSSTKGEFGGEDSISETLLHEYGHTVHRSMGLDWGDPQAGDSNPKTAKYQAVRGQKVSDYGENNDQEHFAETFAQYLSSGSATEEFKSFLENEVGIKKIDVNVIYPEMFRGTRIRDMFIQNMQEADLDGFSLQLTTHTNFLGNMSAADMQRNAVDAQNSGQMPELKVYLEGTVLDSNGRRAGVWQRTFHRASDGKIWIYHNYFKLDDSAQGGGFGTKFINRSFEFYKEELGADRVEVTAALENGPYMWGLMGFDFKMESDRSRKLSHLRDYTSVLEEYALGGSEYENLSISDAARKVQKTLAEAGTQIDGVSALNATLRINKIIQEARVNGWTLSNDFINELKYLMSLPPSQATAQRIANLGRDNRKAKTKRYSSIGRMIMMERSWSGKIYLADWENPRDKAKKDEAK